MRPYLVLSPKRYNCLGLTLIAPIVQRGDHARFKGFSVTLEGEVTQGVVMVNAVTSIDLNARTAKKIETVSSEIIDKALAILNAILDSD